MPYIALYRKYRPLTFDEVVGQKHIVATIKSAIETDKVAHAYLLCGPRGTGKTTIARIIAKAVNCSGEKKPCGVCDNCLEIQAGNHPDIVEIDAASNNGVDEIRELVEKVKYAPLSSKYKVYIIDEVHMLTQSAFNALLKTLEDPPSHVLFILATTEVYKVIPTIISRCQRFDFAKVDIDSLIEKMKEVITKENIQYEEGLLDEIAILAEGGMRDALSILDQLGAYCQNYLDIESLHKVYGLLSNHEKIVLIDNLLNKDIDETLKIIDKVNSQGLDIRRLTNEMTEIIKECIVYSLTKNIKLLSKCSEEQAILITKKADNQHLFSLVDLLMESVEKYRNASNGNLYFETCLLKAINITSDTPKTTVSEPAKTIVKENIIVEKKAEPVVDVIKDVDEEFLLSLLLRAVKESRNEINQKWDSIEDFTDDINYAAITTALKQSEVFAVGEDFVIVKSAYPEIVLQINQEANKDSGILLMELITKKPRQVFAVDQNKCDELVKRFKTLELRKIPLKPAERLDFSHLFKEKEEENRLYKIFGKDGIEVV